MSAESTQVLSNSFQRYRMDAKGFMEETVMTREETKKAMEEYLKDYSTGDFRMALDKHYTDDAVFENTRVRIQGRDKIIDGVLYHK